MPERIQEIAYAPAHISRLPTSDSPMLSKKTGFRFFFLLVFVGISTDENGSGVLRTFTYLSMQGHFRVY